MSTVEAIQLAKHFRQTGQLPTGAPDAGVIMLGLLQAIDDATELKDRLVLDGRANKEEADHYRERFEWWKTNAEAIAKERGELFRAGEALRHVVQEKTYGCTEVAVWDAAAQPVRDMITSLTPKSLAEATGLREGPALELAKQLYREGQTNLPPNLG